MTYSFGIEIETCGVPIHTIQRALTDADIRGCQVKPDGTPSVDAEIVLPVLAPCAFAWEYIRGVCNVLDSVGCRINSKCGLHVHIGNAPLADDTHAVRFCGDSILHTHRTSNYFTQHGDTFDAVIVKDVLWRYARMQGVINGMFPSSRTNNRYCMPNSDTRIANANTITELTSAMSNGKFSAVNLQTWNNGTIEFRQHSGTIEADKIIKWTEFLVNLFEWTITQRIDTGSRTIVHDTPDAPFRRGARVGVQYAMMRNDGGATTRDIMDATGCSEQRVRAAVSEIRNRVGDAAVVTHTQQANGGRYGDGTDLARYEVLASYEEQGNGVSLLPDHRAGNPSIWAGLEDALYETWQDRIGALL